MNPLGGLHALLNRAGNTIHNDVVSPLQHLMNSGNTSQPAPQSQPFLPFNGPTHGAIHNPQAPPVNGPYGGLQLPIWKQGANPFPEPIGFQTPSPDAQNAINSASSIFGWTPAFKSIVEHAQPQINKQAIGKGNLKNGAVIAGEYSDANTAGGHPWIPYNQYVNNQSIQLDPKYSSPYFTTHEGLHAAFQTDPKTQTDFANAYNKSVTPEIAQYLANRLRDYPTAQNVNSFKSFNNLNPSMQTEVHSFLSEYPGYTNKPLPQGLTNYYSRYINPNNVRSNFMQRYQTLTGIQNAISPTNPYVVQPGDE